MEGQLGMKVQGDIKECGQGYRYQAMVCYDQDNRIVETSRCNSHGRYLFLKDISNPHNYRTSQVTGVSTENLTKNDAFWIETEWRR